MDDRDILMDALKFHVIQHLSPLALILVFAGGVLTSIGPCNMAMIPLIIGYVGGSRDLSRRRSFVLSATFATGLALTFMLLGVVVSFVGGLVGAGHAWFYYIVAGICMVIGLQLLRVIRLPIPDFLAEQRQRMTCAARRARWPWGRSRGWWPRSAPRRCWRPS